MSADGWRQSAACLGRDDLDWWPLPSDRIDAQVAVCAGCPVRGECLTDAADDAHAIRGGLRPSERGIDPRCGSQAGYKAHRRAGEQPCPACRAGNVVATQLHRAKRQAEAVAS